MDIEKKRDIFRAFYAFIAKDEERPTLLHILHDEPNGVYVISNGKAILTIADYYFNELTISRLWRGRIEDWPDYKKVMPEGEPQPLFWLSIEDIMKEFNEVPKTTLYYDCPVCKGTGKERCNHCRHKHDCESCDATGKSDRILREGVEPEAGVFYIKGKQFNMCHLSDLAILAHAMGENRIAVHRLEETGIARFEIADGAIVACIMPVPISKPTEPEPYIYKLKTYTEI